MRSGAILAVSVLLKIANDPTTKDGDKLKAVDMILNRSGLHATTEHTVKVEHLDMTEASMVKRIKLLAEKQGLDPLKLLGSVGVIEGEFTVVDDLSDI